MQEGHPTATSGHRTARRKRWDDLERIMRMVSSEIPIITFRYYPTNKEADLLGQPPYYRPPGLYARCVASAVMCETI